MPRITAGKADDIAPGRAVCIKHEGEGIAVFNIDGVYYACDDACPHAGGPLHMSFMSGTVVSCPWHGWTFDLAETGGPPDGVRRFPVSVEAGEIVVDLPD